MYLKQPEAYLTSVCLRVRKARLFVPLCLFLTDLEPQLLLKQDTPAAWCGCTRINRDSQKHTVSAVHAEVGYVPQRGRTRSTGPLFWGSSRTGKPFLLSPTPVFPWARCILGNWVRKGQAGTHTECQGFIQLYFGTPSVNWDIFHMQWKAFGFNSHIMHCFFFHTQVFGLLTAWSASTCSSSHRLAHTIMGLYIFCLYNKSWTWNNTVGQCRDEKSVASLFILASHSVIYNVAAIALYSDAISFLSSHPLKVILCFFLSSRKHNIKH